MTIWTFRDVDVIVIMVSKLASILQFNDMPADTKTHNPSQRIRS